MGFYQHISKYYDEIFPVSDDFVGFVLRNAPRNEALFVDLGCATGELDIQIFQRAIPLGYSTPMGFLGLDLNGTMIDLACKKAMDQNIPAQFFQDDLLNFPSYLHNEKAQCIYCLGNTLPHITGRGLIEKLLKSVHQNLARSGVFLIQMLNYDNIVGQGPTDLPCIQTENVIFNRKNTVKGSDIHFETHLHLKNTNEKWTDTTLLLGLRAKEITLLLQQAGFSEVEVYGNLNQTPWEPSSPLTCVVAKV